MTGFPEAAGGAGDQGLRIAVAHDWLVRYAGSERVVEELLAAFPGARLLTSLLRPAELPETLRAAEPSFLQRVPGAPAHHEWLLPLMPLAWRLRAPVANVDAVVSSSHACAKAVRVAPGIPHLCYCHTPMRYAWDFRSEAARFPRALRPPAAALMGWFRRWDRAKAQAVTAFAANSTAVAERIRRCYGREARVVHPPVRTDFFTPADEERQDYFLFVGRLVSYKRADLAVEAFRELPHPLVVVGEGQQRAELEARATPNVRFLGSVAAERLRELYRGARAFLHPGEEDFGIVMAEAQACGTPVIALRAGGAPDIVEDGVTGFLAERQETEEIRRAVERAASTELDPGVIRARAEQFSSERFRREIGAAVEDLVAGRRA